MTTLGTTQTSRPQFSPLLMMRSFILNYGFYLVMLGVIAFFAIQSPNFLTFENGIRILHTAAPSVILAAGLALVVMMGKLDISVGSTALLSAAVALLLIVRNGAPIPVAFVAALLTGLAIGALNGFIVVRLGVNPLIATIGTMIALRGVALELTGMRAFSLPADVRAIAKFRVGPIWLDMIVALVVVLVVFYIHRLTPFGRHVTAIGNNSETAKRLGVRVVRVTWGVFILSGLFAALGGLFLMLQVESVNSRLGEGYEFTAIALIVIGGISLFGGQGSMLGLIPGALVLTIVESGLNFVGASPFIYPFVRGGIIFAAMYADSLKTLVRTGTRHTTTEESG